MSEERRRLLLPAVAVAAAIGLAWLALRPKEPTPTPTPAPSASASSTPPSMPTGSPSDASFPGRATVLVFDEGQPLVDRWVVFHDPDGSVTSTAKSDAAGKATAGVNPGSMITVAYGTSIRRLVTVAGVMPGDEVLVGEKEDDEHGAGNAVVSAKVKLPGARAGASRYGVGLGVGTTIVTDPATPVPMPVLKRFVSKEKNEFPVLALAYEAKDGGASEPVAFSFLSAKLGTMDASAMDVVLPPWRADFREHRVVVTSVPMGTTSVEALLAIASGEDRFDVARRNSEVAPSTPTTLRFAVPRPLGETAIVRVELGFGASASKIVFAQRVKKMPADLSLDLQKVALASVVDPKVLRGRAPARPRIGFTKRDGAAPTAVIMQLAWPETREHVWTIVAPPSTASGFEAPALPAVLADWAPDGRTLAAQVGLVKATEYAGYDDVRKKGIHVFAELPEDDEETVITSITGDLIF